MTDKLYEHKYIKYKTKYLSLIQKGGEENIELVCREMDNLTTGALDLIMPMAKCSLMNLKSIKPENSKHKLFLEGLISSITTRLKNVESSDEYRFYLQNRMTLNKSQDGKIIGLKSSINQDINNREMIAVIFNKYYKPYTLKIIEYLIFIVTDLIGNVQKNNIMVYNVPSYLSTKLGQNDVYFKDESIIKCRPLDYGSNMPYLQSIMSKVAKVELFIGIRKSDIKYADLIQESINEVQEKMKKLNETVGILSDYNKKFIDPALKKYIDKSKYNSITYNHDLHKCDTDNLVWEINNKCYLKDDEIKSKECVNNYKKNQKNYLKNVNESTKSATEKCNKVDPPINIDTCVNNELKNKFGDYYDFDKNQREKCKNNVKTSHIEIGYGKTMIPAKFTDKYYLSEEKLKKIEKLQKLMPVASVNTPGVVLPPNPGNK